MTKDLDPSILCQNKTMYAFSNWFFFNTCNSLNYSNSRGEFELGCKKKWDQYCLG